MTDLTSAAADLGAIVHENKTVILTALEQYAAICETVGVSSRKTREALVELNPALAALTEALRALPD